MAPIAPEVALAFYDYLGRDEELSNKKSFRSLPSSKSTRLAKRLSEGPRL
jgi:hypothetical protein